MGFSQGFFIRAGERAHEQNMLDIQTKIEKHKAFTDQLKQWSEDPTKLPEAQQAARQRWLEATQAGPMKFKNYDISDILTVNTKSGVPAQGQPITYPGPPQEEGGPADYTNTFEAPARPIPGERNVLADRMGVAGQRSGTYTFGEMAERNAQAAALKSEASLPYQMELQEAKGLGKKEGEYTMTHKDLMQEFGVEYPEGTYKVLYRKGMSPKITPIADMARAGKVMYKPGKGWVQTIFDPATAQYKDAETGDLVPVIPGVTWKTQHDGKGRFYSVGVDQRGQVTGWVPIAPSRYQAGTITNREQMVRAGGGIHRMEITSATKPDLGTSTFNPPETLPLGLMDEDQQQPALSPGIGQPQMSQAVPAGAPPMGVSTSGPSSMPQMPPVPSVGTPPPPQGMSQDVAAPVPPPIKGRTAPEARAKGRPPAAPFVVKDDTPIDPKNVGASLRADFEPTRKPRKSAGAGNQVVDPRANYIKVTAGPLTRPQRNKFKTEEGTLRQTLERAYGVYKRAYMLDNLITAGKLEIAIDPRKSHQLITRIVGKLTPEEAQLAGDFTSLKEDIQKMRTPMGGAGFRSLEAFLALQAQRGSMLGSPEVTKAVLRNSMRVFLTLRGDALYTLHEDAGTPNEMDDDTVDMYMDAYGNDKEASRASRLDGFDQ